MKKLLSVLTVFVMTVVCVFSFKTSALSKGLICIDAPKPGAAVGNGDTYAVNTADISAESHTIKTVSTGYGATTSIETKTISKISPKPNTHIDEPSGGNFSLANALRVRGWSVNVSGVKSVAVYIDNKYMCDAKVGLYRPDVDNQVNKDKYYRDALHSGYLAEISTDKLSSLSGGSHVLKVVSTGYDGTTSTETKTISKISPKPNTHIDEPSSGNFSSANALRVRGWSVNVSGVKSVAVYIDNKYMCDAKVGLYRSDVDNQVNKDKYYRDALHSGYLAEISTDKLSSLSGGNHVLKVVSTGNDGTTSTETKTISKISPKSNTHIDEPSSGNFSSANALRVRGWSVNVSGIKSVAVYIDNKYMCDAKVGLYRPDVNNQVNKNNYYRDAVHSGYLAEISADKLISLSGGNHVLKVVSTGNDGTTSTETKTINEISPKPNTHLDEPSSSNFSSANALRVRGWSINKSGVKSVAVYIDNKYMCDAEVGLYRPDVNNQVNKNNYYRDAVHSGYLAEISTDKLISISGGKHVLKVVSTGNDGTTSTETKTMTKIVPTPKVCIDNPDVSNFYLTDTYYVKGWSLNGTGVKSVSVYIDGAYICDAQTGLPRVDVNRIMNSYNLYKDAEKSGYKVYIPREKLKFLKAGKHTLQVVSIGYDGTKGTSTMTINRLVLDPKICIDNPNESITYNKAVTSSIRVSGWALSSDGVSSVAVAIDGKSIPVTYGINSEQAIIDIAGGRYEGADKARFSTAMFSLSDYSLGKHKVVITITGNNGVVNVINTSFTVSDKYYTNYNITANELSQKTGVDISLIDPDTIINSSSAGIYQFMTLNYVDGITASEMNNMLANCGVLDGHGQDFIDAGKQYNINPVYLAAHARIESGNGKSTLSTGVEIDGVKYYNQFGIHAYDKKAVAMGSEYAKKMGWNSIRSSIFGGAKWIGGIYIWGGKPNQDTLYEMRFDPAYYDGTYDKAWCYATDPDWAKGIANVIYQYRSILDGKSLNFDIPKYK